MTLTVSVICAAAGLLFCCRAIWGFESWEIPWARSVLWGSFGALLLIGGVLGIVLDLLRRVLQ